VSFAACDGKARAAGAVVVAGVMAGLMAVAAG
jgi:hypothetical protein